MKTPPFYLSWIVLHCKRSTFWLRGTVCLKSISKERIHQKFSTLSLGQSAHITGVIASLLNLYKCWAEYTSETSAPHKCSPDFVCRDRNTTSQSHREESPMWFPSSFLRCHSSFRYCKSSMYHKQIQASGNPHLAAFLRFNILD